MSNKWLFFAVPIVYFTQQMDIHKYYTFLTVPIYHIDLAHH